MVTISHVVNKLICDSVYLQEAIGKGIASYGSVAKKLKPNIEDILGKEAAHYAIVAAIRRHAEKMELKFKDIKFDKYSCEVNLKTNVMYINAVRSPTLFDKLKRIYDVINFENGDILHIIYGRNSASIVTNERYNKEICDFLYNEKIISINKNLVSLSLLISKELTETAGVLFQIVRNFAWDDINIIKLITIDLEIIFIVTEKDAVRGYKVLEQLIKAVE
jgi:aspartokinase